MWMVASGHNPNMSLGRCKSPALAQEHHREMVGRKQGLFQLGEVRTVGGEWEAGFKPIMPDPCPIPGQLETASGCSHLLRFAQPPKVVSMS